MTDRKEAFQIGGFVPKSLYSRVLIPLLDGLGWRGSNRDLMEALSNNSDRMDQQDFLHSMANLHFQGHRTKRLSSLDSRNLPCLCHTKGGKLFCLLKLEDDQLLVYDPQINSYCHKKEIRNIREFIYFHSLEKDRLSMLKPQNGWFTKLLMRFRKEFSVILLLSALLMVLSFLTPLLIILIYGQIDQAQGRTILLELAGAVLLFISALAGLRYLRANLQIRISGRMGNLVNHEITRRLLYLPPKFTEKTSRESQFARLRDFESVQNFFGGRALTSLIDAPFAVIMLAGLAFIAGPLAWLPLITMVVFMVLGFFSFQIYRQLNEERSRLSSAKGHQLSEFLTMMKDHGSRWGIPRWVKNIANLSKDTRRAAIQAETMLNRVESLASVLVRLTLVLSIAWGVRLVQDGRMDRGALFASFLIISRILSPLFSGLTVFSQVSKFINSVRQLNRFMALPIEARPETLITMNRHLEGAIRFNRVFLKYSGDFSPVLYRVSFEMKERELMVVAGHGGSGKSSILKLIMAQYAPLSGSIMIDGLNLSQMDPLRLRKSMGYCPSEISLFQGTLRSNLYLAKPDGSDQELENALIHWGLKEQLNKWRNGLDTEMEYLQSLDEHRGILKRIHLAMLTLREGPVNLIDDLEANLDFKDLEELLPMVLELRRSSSLIVVSQYLPLMERADRILWMDNGRVMKEGTPQEVLGEYRQKSHWILEEQL